MYFHLVCTLYTPLQTGYFLTLVKIILFSAYDVCNNLIDSLQPITQGNTSPRPTASLKAKIN